ncbi:Nuclear receptor 2C2-associated protein [Dinochytrium kinnereticum]|nr:Nuclear receptor 2C2-associated protein [Dinochytrium kinnereticum]
MSLLDGGFVKVIKVSSVLNRDGKNFGRQFLTDRNDETCWNSDQGSPQWISVDFTEAVQIQKIAIMFQGGFAGQTCKVMVQSSEPTDVKAAWEGATTFYPDDVNSKQAFDIEAALGSQRVWALRVVFENSFDTYGRILVYDFDILGVKAS